RLGAMVTTGHNPGIWKQQNKSHKHGRHRSKSQIDGTNKGRVEATRMRRKHRKELQKVDRRHRLQQIRSQKREQVLLKKRNVGVGGSPPHLVLLVPLHKSVDTSAFSDFMKLIGTSDDCAPVEAPLTSAGFTMNVGRLKHRFQIFQPGSVCLHDVADCARVADAVVFLVSAEKEAIDETGFDILSCLLAQGISSHGAWVLRGVLFVKLFSSVLKESSNVWNNMLGRVKLLQVDTESEAFNMLRMVAGMKRKGPGMLDQRSYILVEKMEFQCGVEDDRGVLKVTGHIRGSVLDVNRLVHLPGWGDYQVKQVDTIVDPSLCNVQKISKVGASGDEVFGFHATWSSMSCDLEEETIFSDPSRIQDLVLEADPNPMEGEQTWPTEEEIMEAEEEQADAMKQSRKVKKKVPRGTSEYQAAWILDSDEDWREGSSEEEEEEMQSPPHDGGSQVSTQMDDDDHMTIPESEIDESLSQYDDTMDEDDLARFREERNNELFPDEVDTPADTPARTRFQRYRGLKSFRTSPWDPKENLPSDYARIFQFQSFDRTRKRLRNQEVDDATCVGKYVTIHLMNVPKVFVTSHRASSPLTLFAMYPHEQKLSVLHFTLKQHGEHSIRNKDKLLFQCGFRRFRSKVILSQHTSGSKHKVERYFPKTGIVVATVYAPIMFPPANVLVYKEREGDALLVATGSLYKIDPDRIITKRIVLSGHPFRINKRAATVRYMFFNRDDINWFKPVELRTKYGRRGHIKEPIGTHGHMKCFFDSQLTSQDTVLMTLYKRVFPKWSI
uniref:Pre-rRNA-processing protein TSR1 homolog n=1 Tax=Ciona savignyi TaxID=51511 RepID=H2YCV5_CIOSA